MNTPYDTGRVKIGANYQPDNRPVLTADDERIQAALLKCHRVTSVKEEADMIDQGRTEEQIEMNLAAAETFAWVGTAIILGALIVWAWL